MLNFILGAPASGKTYTILNKIKEFLESEINNEFIYK